MLLPQPNANRMRRFSALCPAPRTHKTLNMPNRRVHIVCEALPPLALKAVCKDAHALADCDNFWVTKERILQGPSACSTPAELAVCLLYQHVAHLLPATWQGAEYWVQVYKPGAGLGFHFDKDEHLLKATGQMQHPIWSSILYLTGSSSSSSSSNSDHNTPPTQQQPLQHPHHAQSAEAQPQQQQQRQQQQPDLSTLQDWDGVRQAPTVILDQLYDQQAGCPVPAAPSSSMVVWPLKGTYCVFDGRLGHGVLDSGSSSIRATLLVNWWTSCPQAVEPLQDGLIEQQQLTRLDSATLQQLVSSNSSSSTGGGSSSGSDGAGTQADASCCNSVAKQLAAVSLNDVSSSSNSSSSCNAEQDTAQQPGHHRQQQQQQQYQVPCVRVTSDTGGSSDEGGSMQLVDDVLAQNKLTLTGPTAVSAVRFDHPGFVLCPIEDPSASSSSSSSDAAAAAASGSSGGSSAPPPPPRLQTLAAFVSAELMEDDSSSSCCSDSDGAGEAGA